MDKIPTLPQTPGETNAVTWNFDPDLTYELAPVSSESFPDDKCPLGEIVATLTRTKHGNLGGASAAKVPPSEQIAVGT